MNEILLEIKDLHVRVEGTEILKGINLIVRRGEVHALMGPNGCGKSTLASVIAGNPKYEVTSGSITYLGKDVIAMKVHERATKGIFLSFQHPAEISGVTISNFLRTAYNVVYPEEKLSVLKFKRYLKEKLEFFGLDPEFGERYLNEGFSGGEKKKSEMLQLAVLNPTLAIMDETDSGLDIDSLRTLSTGVKEVMTGSEKASLVITHYKRILEYLKPDRVSIMKEGKIVLEGGAEIVDRLENEGFGWIEEEKDTIK